ncbi:hypothetical protein DSM107010_60220 [Chroococcidiopsis cubana SAG 39.79]|uniref:Uncharacterized protein n=1 Tax=Chroococcidiopsis cubana SAG 39.79 TaxID=388085 RepID=A0AB37UBH5_9CYAN|nr:hypothetical protein DSM107010_60220 [Chroococcidiopsis cubana SAG 39.79]
MAIVGAAIVAALVIPTAVANESVFELGFSDAKFRAKSAFFLTGAGHDYFLNGASGYGGVSK